MNDTVMSGVVKAMMMKEVLASCQMEGIGLELTLEDLYLEELKTSQKTSKQNNYPTRQTVQTESGEELSKDETCSASSTEAKTGDLNSRGRKQ